VSVIPEIEMFCSKVELLSYFFTLSYKKQNPRLKRVSTGDRDLKQ
jgi:hypothetical protein